MAKSTGRFNYMIISKDNCQLVFKPNNHVMQVVVAESLTLEQASNLMEDLNVAVDETCSGARLRED